MASESPATPALATLGTVTPVPRPQRLWPGLALATAGSIAFSGKAIIVKLAYRYGVDAVTLIMYRMLFALVRPLSATHVASQVLWLSLLNATACTFAPVLMVMMAIERVGATVAAPTGMVGPLSTILMGVVILGEPFTVWIGIGTVFVLSGIWMLARAHPKSDKLRTP